eukprot:sb/3472867/
MISSVVIARATLKEKEALSHRVLPERTVFNYRNDLVLKCPLVRRQPELYSLRETILRFYPGHGVLIRAFYEPNELFRNTVGSPYKEPHSTIVFRMCVLHILKTMVKTMVKTIHTDRICWGMFQLCLMHRQQSRRGKGKKREIHTLTYTPSVSFLLSFLP